MPSTSKPGESPPDRRVPPKPTRTIHLAHSPDADDAFMFWALAAGKIDTGDRRYEHELADIETLNRSEEHTSELQSQSNLVCRLLLEKKKKKKQNKKIK